MSERSSEPKPTGFSFALLVSTLAALALFKWTVIGKYRLDDLFIGLGVEMCTLGFLWWISERLGAYAKGSANVARGIMFFPAFYFIAGLIFSYTFFFDSAVERRFSLLDVSADGMLYFFTNVLPPRGFLVLFGLIVVGHVGAVMLQRTRIQPSARAAIVFLLVLTVTTTVAARNAPRVATPLYDIAYDAAELLLTPRVVVESGTKPFRPITLLDKSKKPATISETPFKRVLVFVMETTTSKMLREELAPLSRDSFLWREQSHMHSFSRYFPNNQDSRTGMLDLVLSQLIPYEAYTDEGVAKYQYVKNEPSLLQRFAALGYKHALAVSQSDFEPVITEMPWHEIIKLNDQEIEAAKQNKKLCFTPYEFEHSCEDLVLLPKVISFFEKHEKAFVFQEMMWGHASEYNDASGLSTVAYYSQYLDAVVTELKKRNMLDETLIAITSDHGFRSKGLQGQLDAYQIPLMFYASRFTAKDDGRLFSHLDFKDLLFNEMAPGSATIDDNPLVMIQGPTGTQMIAALTSNDDFLLVKTRGTTRLKLTHENFGAKGTGAAQREESAPELVKMFDDYRAAFEARGKNAAKL